MVLFDWYSNSSDSGERAFISKRDEDSTDRTSELAAGYLDDMDWRWFGSLGSGAGIPGCRHPFVFQIYRPWWTAFLDSCSSCILLLQFCDWWNKVPYIETMSHAQLSVGCRQCGPYDNNSVDSTTLGDGTCNSRHLLFSLLMGVWYILQMESHRKSSSS